MHCLPSQAYLLYCLVKKRTLAYTSSTLAWAVISGACLYPSNVVSSVSGRVGMAKYMPR